MNVVKWSLVIVCMISMGFFQEWVKVNINFTLEQAPKVPGFYTYPAAERSAKLEQLKRNSPFDYYHSHYPIGALQHFSESSLKKLKWMLTVFFVLWFFAVNQWLVKRIIHDPRGSSWIQLTYVISFLGAFFIYSLGWFFGHSDLFYNISRKMVGALQSPIPVMMNWAGWQLYLHHK